MDTYVLLEDAEYSIALTGVYSTLDVVVAKLNEPISYGLATYTPITPISVPLTPPAYIHFGITNSCYDNDCEKGVFGDGWEIRITYPNNIPRRVVILKTTLN